ncbi:STAS domain-containing protein [Blastococcus saxobsidens]|uniref:STAS domain-containing protein n=1 Tax=Blastococcus saxobsidens TaxID=138336 RepID=A0A4Q7Y4X3_9ACTN|nr:STAS domain-containing protein [Blastococcus saxobsidens]RZU31932.1 STAS domain-containing protein [Blastococcus saxobsidens]
MSSGPHPRSTPDRDSFTETIDGRLGAISAQGHLTTRAADMVRGTVEVLRRSGHDRVVVDLQGVERADDDGLRALHALADGIRADGGRLMLLHPPRPWQG